MATGAALSHASRSASYVLGASVIVLAVAAAATSLSLHDIIAWAQKMFGVTFIVLLGGLISATVYCWVRALNAPGAETWIEAGQQMAGGIATLALTYTLLGISLGIGTLAEQDLTPDTVQTVIRGLTAQFSLAFMTTVVGLPVSAVLRALLAVTAARARDRAAVHKPVAKGAA